MLSIVFGRPSAHPASLCPQEADARRRKALDADEAAFRAERDAETARLAALRAELEKDRTAAARALEDAERVWREAETDEARAKEKAAEAMRREAAVAEREAALAREADELQRSEEVVDRRGEGIAKRELELSRQADGLAAATEAAEAERAALKRERAALRAGGGAPRPAAGRVSGNCGSAAGADAGRSDQPVRGRERSSTGGIGSLFSGLSPMVGRLWGSRADVGMPAEDDLLAAEESLEPPDDAAKEALAEYRYDTRAKADRAGEQHDGAANGAQQTPVRPARTIHATCCVALTSVHAAEHL
jgi:hypothetical protein